MQKLFKTRLFFQVVMATLVATLATVGIVAATTTIGTSINTGGTLTVTTTTATSTISTGGLTVGTNQFVVQQTSGNVGIGTTNPVNGSLEVVSPLPTAIAGVYAVGGGASGAITGPAFHGHANSGNGNTRVFQLSNNNGDIMTVSQLTMTYSGNVGIGTTTPNNLLSVYDLIDFNNTDFNTKIGYQAGKNIVAGSADNTFIGYQSGFASSTASTNATDYNTAIGYKSFWSNTVGYNNTATGYSSLRSNTTGAENSATGFNSLYNNTTGTTNSAFGDRSLNFNTAGASNSAVGAKSLYLNTAGDYNSAVGASSLSSNSTGSYNTVLGLNGGFNITTGSFNIIIGQNVNATSSTATGQLNIGNVIFGTGMYSGTTVSNTPTANGMIGIGTSSPASLLHVSAGTNATTTVEFGAQAVTSKTCFNVRDALGAATSFYFVGTAMVVEPNRCR